MKEAGYEVYVLAVPKHGGLGAWGARSAWHTVFGQGSGVCPTVHEVIVSWWAESPIDPAI